MQLLIVPISNKNHELWNCHQNVDTAPIPKNVIKTLNSLIMNQKHKLYGNTKEHIAYTLMESQKIINVFSIILGVI